MKTLNLHVDYIEWQGLKKALKNIEDYPTQDISKKRVEEALVVLTAIEKNDSLEILPEYIKNIKEIAEQVKTKNIVLYPYAHLSSNLGKPSVAIEILEKAEKELKKQGFQVSRAPFGYYKSFELKVKGHPLSELSREIIIEGNEETTDINETERKNLLKQISKSILDTSKLAENDHRIIGKKMDLWSFNSVAPGMVFWHDKGLSMKNKLIEYWRELHRRENYQEISTPQIMDRKLWEISGHWSKYGENNFKTSYEKRDFLVKPMNCPGGMLVYKNSPKSYKDLPLRVGEIGIVHRVELSGVLSGLFRVIQFTQDDAHIFCTEKQAKQEISKIMDLTKEILDTFGLKIDHIELSTRPEKRIGTDKEWDFAEKTLEKVLKSKKIKYKINKGDGAFYGAKIDYHLKDSLNRTWQCSTIQFDMSLPRRFNLTYIDEKGNEKRPIMLHRAIYGSIERFLGIITEQCNGKFPLWFSPNQIKILTLNQEVENYAKGIKDKLFEQGFKVELDARNESLGKKVREASIERYNYILTIGKNEEKNKTLAIKQRGQKETISMNLEEFIKKLKQEIIERK
jgi:threonyl-tRNA synthetase